MDIDDTNESVKLLKEEFKKKIDIIVEKGVISNEDCIFLKNIYSTYLSYIMFYIYLYAYDKIIINPELFGDNIKIKEILLSTMEFKFGYDSTKFNLNDIIDQIKYIYIQNVTRMKNILNQY